MQLLDFNLPMDWNLFLFGDDHIGASLRYEEGFSHMVDMMHSEYQGLKPSRNYGVHHGDPVEAIMVDDYRFSLEETKSQLRTVMKQVEASIEALEPIRSKLLFMLDGNHTRKLRNYGDITKHICDKLGTKYGTFAAKISYKNSKGEIQFKHFAIHGTGSISSAADDPERAKTNMKLQLKRKLKKKAGDVMLCSQGHTHKLLVVPPTEDLFLTDDGKRIHQQYTHRDTQNGNGYIHPDYRYYVNSGSFLKLFGYGFSGYAEIAGYDPIELGFAVALIRGGRIQEIKKVVV